MVTLDSDGHHGPEQIPDIEPLKQGFDIVIDSRYISKDDEEKVPRFRSFGIRTKTKTDSGNESFFSEIRDNKTNGILWNSYINETNGKLSNQTFKIKGKNCCQIKNNSLFRSVPFEESLERT